MPLLKEKRASTLAIELYEQQHEFVMSEKRFTAFIGGIGTGKTTAGAVKCIIEANRIDEPSVGLVIAPTYPMLRDATLRTFRDVVGSAIVNFHKSDMIATLVDGSEVLFRSADDPDKLRGPNLDWVWMDEAAMCHRGTWDIVIGRLRRGGRAGKIWLTSTPKGRNWMYDKLSLLKMFHATTMDNPYLSDEFVESLQEAYVGDFALQELGGEFVKFEGMVYPGFSPQVHVFRMSDEDLQGWDSILAVDIGTRNPTAILTIRSRGGEEPHIEREYYQRGLSSEGIISAIEDEYYRTNAREIIVDPTANSYILTLIGKGLPARKGNNDIIYGIGVVSSVLDHGDLTIDPGCVNTLMEIESYHYPNNTRADPEKDVPAKEGDHAMDAMRYGLVRLVQPMREVNVL